MSGLEFCSVMCLGGVAYLVTSEIITFGQNKRWKRMMEDKMDGIKQSIDKLSEK